jgi:hypothetical protein
LASYHRGALFLVWPPRVWFRPPRPVGLTLLRVSAVIVVAVTVAVGLRAIAVDLDIAFRKAWSMTVPPRLADQMSTVERVMKSERVLLLTYEGNDPWVSEVWQSALYPREVIVVPNAWATPAGIARLRARFRFRFAVSIGERPLDAGFATVRDVGPSVRPGERTWFGPLR